jgi:hypothetical protein
MRRSSAGRVLFLAVALSAAGLWASPARAGVSGATCAGQAPTIFSDVNNAKITGTGGPDVIFVTGQNSVVHGYGGDDVICTDVFIAEVFGGSGHDVILGTPFFCAGSGTAYGGSGDDEISCYKVIRGESGNDSLQFGFELYGGSGSDALASNFSGLCDGGSGTDSATASCGTIKNVP